VYTQVAGWLVTSLVVASSLLWVDADNQLFGELDEKLTLMALLSS
jgi:hypothetical protein